MYGRCVAPANAAPAGWLISRDLPSATEPRRRREDGVRRRIAELAAERPRFGYRRLTALLKRESVSVWHGRVHRIAKELRLHVPRRKHKRLASSNPAAAITRSNQLWGMDFVTDSLADGRSFRALAVVDHYTRECPVIEVDLSLPGTALCRLAEERGCRMPFALTTARNSFALPCAADVNGRNCSWTTSSLASPCRTGTLRASMGSSAMNA